MKNTIIYQLASLIWAYFVCTGKFIFIIFIITYLFSLIISNLPK